jgi:hypothetical protein
MRISTRGRPCEIEVAFLPFLMASCIDSRDEEGSLLV